MKKIISTNPAKNYEVIGSVNISILSEIKQKVKEANQAKTYWKELGSWILSLASNETSFRFMLTSLVNRKKTML